MFSLEKHYVEMCNWAHEATDREKLLRKLSNEQVRALQSLVLNETAAGRAEGAFVRRSENGKVKHYEFRGGRLYPKPKSYKLYWRADDQ